MKRLSIDELAEEVNKIIDKEPSLSSSLVTDKRRKKHITVRRIRDWQTRNEISPPIRDGRNTFYTNEHVKEVLKNREAQELGYSDRTMSLYKDSDSDKALAEIANIRKGQEQGLNPFSNAKIENERHKTILRNSTRDFKYSKLSQEPVSYSEYTISLETTELRISVPTNDIQNISEKEVEEIKEAINNIFIKNKKGE